MDFQEEGAINTFNNKYSFNKIKYQFHSQGFFAAKGTHVMELWLMIRKWNIG